MKVKVAKITRIPSGEAPEWVLREWIGLEFPVFAEYNKGRGVMTGKIVEMKYWVVDIKIALNILSRSSPSAYEWWLEHISSEDYFLQFNKDACEIMEVDG